MPMSQGVPADKSDGNGALWCMAAVVFFIIAIIFFFFREIKINKIDIQYCFYNIL
jgi:hypothetical protein